jgi:tagaturonate reductase
VKVLQFGEGNFLRAFVDYFIDIANEKAGFNGSVVLVKPIAIGSLFPAFKEQDYRYTVMLRGLVDGQAVEQSRVVTSVSDAVDAYTDYDAYAAYAKCETLRFIVSNTTEAGIVLDESDKFELCPPNTYPGKLTKFLYVFVHPLVSDGWKYIFILSWVFC